MSVPPSASSGDKASQQWMAERLVISRATVSRCFTNHPAINPKTRAAVFELAARVGYEHLESRTPKKRGRAKEYRVGVLICSDPAQYLSGDYSSPGAGLVAGVSEYAQAHQMRVEIHYVDPALRTLEAGPLHALVGGRRRPWDGVILIYPFHTAVVAALQARFPVVSLVEQPGVAHLDCVDVDHALGMSVIIDRLVALGHGRIGFYTRRYPVEAGWSLRRYAAYVEKLARLGWELRTKDVVNVYADRGLEEGHAEVLRRVQEGTTAWVCAADHQAYDLVKALKHAGLSVPGDVSVTGFDGIAKPARLAQATTIQIPYREIGLTGARRLLDLMGKRFETNHHIQIAGRLVEGRTAGKCFRK